MQPPKIDFRFLLYTPNPKKTYRLIIEEKTPIFHILLLDGGPRQTCSLAR